MRISVVAGIVAAAIWIIVKMIFFYTMEVGYDITPLILLNMFLLLGGISVGLYISKLREKEETNALHDIKEGMKSGVPYAVIVAVFIYFYYDQIDPEYNAHRIAEMEYMYHNELMDPEKVKLVKEANPDFEVLSNEQIEKNLIDSYRRSTSANSTFVLALLGMVVLSAMNSIFVTIIYRKVVFRPRANSPGVSNGK